MVIDPLALPDLEPLWQFLGRSRANQGAARGAAGPGSARDSRRAASPCPDRSSTRRSPRRCSVIRRRSATASLVAERLGHTLAKGHTRTDWTRRPLTPEQLQYAADDVRYLVPLYLDLREALEAAGRLDWLYEETRELEQLDLYRTEPDAAWRRLKGLDRLQPQQRATAKLLAQWREARPSSTTSRAAGFLPTMRCAKSPSGCPRRLRDLEGDPQLAAGCRAPARRGADGAASSAAAATLPTKRPRAIRRAPSRSSWRWSRS